jgi:Trk K+ transport system NAD-binding subunit
MTARRRALALAAVVAAMSTDADNLFVVMPAKALNAGLRVAARASDEQTERKLVGAAGGSRE